MIVDLLIALVVHLLKTEKTQKFMRTGNTNVIYKNDLDKACFQHDMAYGKYKDLTKRTESDRVVRDKAFKFANNPKHIGYQRGLASMVYKFFDKYLKPVVLNLCQINNLHMNFINQLLKNLTKGKFILHLKTISGALI